MRGTESCGPASTGCGRRAQGRAAMECDVGGRPAMSTAVRESGADGKQFEGEGRGGGESSGASTC